MPPSSGRQFVLGIGLSGNADIDEAIALAETVIGLSEFDPRHLVCVATIDQRGDNPVLIALVHHLGTSIRTFDAAALEAETPRLKNPSAVLFDRIGCHGVAEAAALAAAGGDSILIVEKVTGRHVTAAIAARPAIS